jgi:PAS domain S-box-containing protein
MPEFNALAQHLLQFSPDAMLVVDSAGAIQYANETAEAVFGYAPRQLVGQSMDLLIPDRFRRRHAAHMSEFLRSPANREMGARIVDLLARRVDGSEFPAGIRLAPFSFDGSDYVAVAVRDMTERRAVNDALVAAREEADRANRAKSRFLAAASHDLRQPMQAIRLLNASLLKLAGEDANLCDLLHHQEHAIGSATDLLNALLDISRLESGAIEPELSAVEIADVFAELQREFAASATAKHLDLHFAKSASVLMTDRTLFRQLLQNLIGNALKYTDCGYVRVSQSIDTDAVTIQIEDSGIGIPADKLDRIFDEYYQVDTRAGTQRLGVGLGLAIVREVSRLLGFLIAVSSKLGEGTRVRVRIPRQKLLLETHLPSRQSSARATAAAAHRCGIVLIEDNQSVRTATELFFNLEGFEIRSAAGAAEAQRLIADMRPGDLLITDFRIDGKLTGLDLLTRARAQHHWRVPAVLLSGDLESMMRAIKDPLPDCRFLSKPIDANALLAAIAELAGT